jgi:hypothetical protein
VGSVADIVQLPDAEISARQTRLHTEPLLSPPPQSVTSFFSLNSHSTTTKLSIQYLVLYLNILHAFF